MSKVSYLVSPLCVCCGDSLPGNTEGDHFCENCLRTPPSFSVARGIALYQNPVKQLLHNLKYNFDTTTLGPLLLIAQSSDFSTFESCDIILPVPLHSKRLKRRGMNQALFLARLFFPERKEDIYTDVLVRERPTISQTSLDLQGRKKNLSDAFTVKNIDIITNKVICLVDDVFTTGATVEECSRSIIAAGGTEVRVLTLARVVTRR